MRDDTILTTKSQPWSSVVVIAADGGWIVNIDQVLSTPGRTFLWGGLKGAKPAVCSCLTCSMPPSSARSTLLLACLLCNTSFA